jgi:hypothetical protein
MSGLK